MSLFMCRIPPVGSEKYHIVGEVNEAGAAHEPDRAFWTNATVKALMAQGPEPEYVSACGKVRGDWRSVQVANAPFGELCGQCERTTQKEIS